MKRNRMRAYAVLGRLRISLLAASASLLGYLLAAYQLTAGMFITGAGVFLLSCSASALNQYQERAADALMERTRMRPLPAGVLTVGEALLFASCTGFAGLGLILLAGGRGAMLAGLFAVLWYNGVYTNLKPLTAFAAVPGALVGAVPVALGWKAASGSLADPALILLCIFFFLWQVPHFWLYCAEYRREYAEAGLPAVTGHLSLKQLSRVVFAWISALAVCALFFIPYGIILHRASGYCLVTLSALLVAQGAGILKRNPNNYKRLSIRINLYLLSVMAVLFADRAGMQ